MNISKEAQMVWRSRMRKVTSIAIVFIGAVLLYIDDIVVPKQNAPFEPGTVLHILGIILLLAGGFLFKEQYRKEIGVE